MKLAMYRGDGVIAIEDAPVPACPAGGLLVRVEASALCSGELMAWYMDQKAPHVLGHEFSGIVIQSEADAFPVGCRVAPHHHAPCMACSFCAAGHYVHCAAWKRTKLNPGGLAEYVAVSEELLKDCHQVDDLDPRDAALTEPLACVMKSLRRARWQPGDRTAVIGLGVMGLMHMLRCAGATGIDISASRREWATRVLNSSPREAERVTLPEKAGHIQPPHPSPLPLGSGGEGADSYLLPRGGGADGPPAAEGVRSFEGANPTSKSQPPSPRSSGLPPFKEEERIGRPSDLAILAPLREQPSGRAQICDAAEPKAFDVVFVCPGSDAALEAGLKLAAPGARVVLFAPTEPGHKTSLELNQLYFQDIELITCYSCGPDDTEQAVAALRAGIVRAEQVVSHFIEMNELPNRYLEMKAGTILKPMVLFPNSNSAEPSI